MRHIGKRIPREPALVPSAEYLHSARAHQETGRALASLATTGIAKGIYRFSSHDAMNRHSDEGIVRAIAENVRRRSGGSDPR